MITWRITAYTRRSTWSKAFLLSQQQHTPSDLEALPQSAQRLQGNIHNNCCASPRERAPIQLQLSTVTSSSCPPAWSRPECPRYM